MKWKNKGHELDRFGERISQYFLAHQKVFIFGAGTLGGELKPLLEKYGCFGGFIDNNLQKQKTGYLDSRVYSLAEYLSGFSGCWMVLAVSTANSLSIKKQLEENGLKRGKDYFGITDFLGCILPILSVYYYDKMYMELAQICLTERCSLKCKKCAHACYAVDKNAEDMSLEMVCQSADSFFSKVDVIQEFVLIGGEPLLHKNIAEAVEYIGKRYRDQIVIFSITTNGTVIPRQELLDVCCRYDVTFRISNYSVQIPGLSYRYEALVSKLEENHILYRLAPADAVWMDYGFEYVDRKADEETLEEVFDACRTPCREIRGNRLYYCVMARSVSDNLKLGIGSDDYLDLNVLDEKEYDKKVLLEYTLGYSEKGYLEMCNYCHGAEAAEFQIPVAEQL